MNIVPDEVLLNILRYLAYDDNLFNVGNVCARWKRIAADWTLYKQITVDCFDTDEAVRTLTKYCRRTTSLTLTGFVQSDSILTEGLNSCTTANLRELTLTNCHLLCDDRAAGLLRFLKAGNVNLQTIRVSDSNLQCHLSDLLQALCVCGNRKSFGLKRIIIEGPIATNRMRWDSQQADELPSVCRANVDSLACLKLCRVNYSIDNFFRAIGQLINLCELCLRFEIIQNVNGPDFLQLINLPRLNAFTLTNVAGLSVETYVQFLATSPARSRMSELNFSSFINNTNNNDQQLENNNAAAGAIILKAIADSCPNLRVLVLTLQNELRLTESDVFGLLEKTGRLEKLYLFECGASLAHSLPAIIANSSRCLSKLKMFDSNLTIVNGDRQLLRRRFVFNDRQQLTANSVAPIDLFTLRRQLAEYKFSVQYVKNRQMYGNYLQCIKY